MSGSKCKGLGRPAFMCTPVDAPHGPRQTATTGCGASSAMSEDPENEQVLHGFRLLNAPGHLLRRAHQRSYEIFSAIVGEDVTRQQMALLIALYQNPGAAQNRLVDFTGFDRATIAEMLGRMVSRGWVSRCRDPQDGRAWTMHITAEGRNLLLDRIALVAKAQDEILAPLPEAMRPVFMQCLRILLGLGPEHGSGDGVSQDAS